ncbi:MAG: phosphoribosylanthranilate isomerase [Proteobacteria bacterium]|nr:phosphoribosylanthranilate isomerase [Pseudomonadota bacterium]
MWIKICGMTTPDAVGIALELGVDALGFVFAPSARRVTPEFAVRLAKPARGRVQCVAVTRHPVQNELDEMLRVFAPDVLQADLAELEALDLPAGLARMPVVRTAQAAPTLPRRILFEGPVSGAGQVSDWVLAATLARRTELVLAGGLTCTNVGAAIAAVRPFGVDVSSGVEERPGVKSPAEISNFVGAVRGACVN